MKQYNNSRVRRLLLLPLLPLLGNLLSVGSAFVATSTTTTTTTTTKTAFVIQHHHHHHRQPLSKSTILSQHSLTSSRRLSSTSSSTSSRISNSKSSSTQLSMATSSPTTTPYKKIFVAGGSRGVGRYVIDKLLQLEGVEQVVALVRTDLAVQKLLQEEVKAGKHVKVIQGDAMDYKTVENAMDGCDAAITTLGGGTVLEGDNPQQPQQKQQRIDYQGNNNVIEAAGILGVTRVILVTSIGCGSSKAAAPPSVFEVLKDMLAAKERAENVLIKYYTNMNWTIIRPGGLKTEPATGRAILTEDTTAIGSVHREDVANLIVQALASPKTERKVLSALDPTLTSAVNLDGRNVQAFALV